MSACGLRRVIWASKTIRKNRPRRQRDGAIRRMRPSTEQQGDRETSTVQRGGAVHELNVVQSSSMRGTSEESPACGPDPETIVPATTERRRGDRERPGERRAAAAARGGLRPRPRPGAR